MILERLIYDVDMCIMYGLSANLGHVQETRWVNNSFWIGATI